MLELVVVTEPFGKRTAEMEVEERGGRVRAVRVGLGLSLQSSQWVLAVETAGAARVAA